MTQNNLQELLGRKVKASAEGATAVGTLVAVRWREGDALGDVWVDLHDGYSLPSFATGFSVEEWVTPEPVEEEIVDVES